MYTNSDATYYSGCRSSFLNVLNFSPSGGYGGPQSFGGTHVMGGRWADNDGDGMADDPVRTLSVMQDPGRRWAYGHKGGVTWYTHFAGIDMVPFYFPDVHDTSGAEQRVFTQYYSGQDHLRTATNGKNGLLFMDAHVEYLTYDEIRCKTADSYENGRITWGWWGCPESSPTNAAWGWNYYVTGNGIDHWGWCWDYQRDIQNVYKN
jgi:hypothetical protein